MIKYFCDICGKETIDEGRLKETCIINKEKTILFEVMVGLNGVWNTGNFHHKCIAALIGNKYGNKK